VQWSWCGGGIGKSWPAAELAHLDTCQPSTNRHLTSAYSAIGAINEGPQCAMRSLSGMSKDLAS
jgi:hypothetical protein